MRCQRGTACRPAQYTLRPSKQRHQRGTDLCLTGRPDGQVSSTLPDTGQKEAGTGHTQLRRQRLHHGGGVSQVGYTSHSRPSGLIGTKSAPLDGDVADFEHKDGINKHTTLAHARRHALAQALTHTLTHTHTHTHARTHARTDTHTHKHAHT